MCKTINLNFVNENDVNLLQFCWKHRLTAYDNRLTTDGREVKVTDPGLHNRYGDAPDFFNAKVYIDGTLWVGNVVVTDKASNWYVKGMDKKKAYDNVVLLVAGVADTEILTSQGQQVAVVPTLFAYGRAKAREDYCDLAFDLMEQCKAERNEITKYWEQLGVRSMTAGDSQSLIQLQREYCNKHQCLRCRFGYEFLKK